MNFWIMDYGAVWRVEVRLGTVRLHGVHNFYEVTWWEFIRRGMWHPNRRMTPPRGAVPPRYGLKPLSMIRPA